MVNRTRIIEEFTSLVAIDALSYQERDIADRLKISLSELGFAVNEDDAGKYYSGNCGNIYGYLQGEVEGEPLLFSAHMDTVGPGTSKKAILKGDGTITSDGSTVLGADDLSGIVSILEAVRTIKEKGLPHRSIEVLFPIAEEVYIRGSEVFDFTKIKAKEAYVLDLSGEVGTAALSAPTLVSFTAEILGKASHAGFAPELGINAIAVAAHIITKIEQGRIDGKTTVNIGLIEGGKARNIVSDSCILKGEVRSLNHENALNRVKKIEKVIQETVSEFHASYELTSEFGCLAYKISEDQPVVKRFVKACWELDITTELRDTFGGSDNNNFVRHGISGIVIASGMNQVHSCSEYTHIDELEKSANIVIKLMTEKDSGL